MPAADVTPALAYAESYTPPACRDCGSAMTSRFCPDCGQRAVTARLTVGALAGDFAGQFVAIDRGLWFTALAVLRGPGDVARRWLDGQRRRFVGPIAFLSFAAALLLLGVRWINSDDLGKLRDSARVLTQGEHPVLSARQADVYAGLAHDMAQQELLLSVLIAIPFAVAVRRLFRRTGINLAEAGVLSLYAFADACLLYLPIVPLVKLFAADPVLDGALRGWGTFAVYAIAAVHAGRGFFDRRPRTAVRMLVALVAAFLCFFVVQGVLPIVWILLTVPR